MRKKVLLLLIFIFTSGLANAQELSPNAVASILTMGPGQSLYDSFGHTAIRITDPVNGLDVVYNYGVYDFSDPNFYAKFAKGNMRYLLDRKPTEYFLNRYIDNNRWIKEQLLALSPAENQKLLEFLENNLKPENRAYSYDFFYDNCATKIPEVLGKVIEGGITIDPSYIAKPKTFRTLIQENVHWNTWGSFGMDLGIGSVTDRLATPWEHLFLPENVLLGLNSAYRTQQEDFPLVIEEKVLFENNPVALRSDGWKSPLAVIGLLALFILIITYKDYKSNKRSKWLDVSLALVTGVIGVFLLLLWFGTNHSTTANNYNVLWAFPFNLLLVYHLAKTTPKKWVGRYLRWCLIMFVLLCMHWFLGVQVFAKALIPLLVALALRYIYVIRYLGSLPAIEDNGA